MAVPLLTVWCANADAADRGRGPVRGDPWHDVRVLLPGPAVLVGVAIIVGVALLVANRMSKH